MRTKAFLVTIAAWLAALAASSPTPAMTREWNFVVPIACPGHYQGITYYRGQARRFERLMAKPASRLYGLRFVDSCDGVIPYLNRIRNIASTRARQYAAYLRAMRATGIPAGLPPHHDAWLCIHRYEGSWAANTGNGYYGGLQMDLGFQKTYGPKLLARKGTADHWTPREQMWTAEKAYSSGRGFHPWPNTARYCGLL